MTWTRSEVSLLLLLGGALGLCGCSRENAQAAGTPREVRNVVLISIDTCRADRLSCYGFDRPTTPNIDAIARDGVLFENVISPVPATLPAHSSMLTGTVPPYHGVHANNNYRLSASNVTLAELLKKEGFTTAAFVSSFTLDAQFGLNQGFDTYNQDLRGVLGATASLNERNAENVNRAVLPWLDDHASDRFFLMVHYYDPHTPYAAPEPFRTDFAADPYVAEIAYTDHQIGLLIDKLKALGLYDSTLLIVTADHGEGLNQHGEKWHGFFVYHDTTRVPLIIKSPGVSAGARIEEKVGLIDIVPTVLAVLGVPDAPTIQGRDLTPYLSGRKTVYPDRYFYSESLMPTQNGCNALFAIEDQSWKYIQSKRPELYHLVKDPGEKDNLFDKESKRGTMYKDRLQQMLSKVTRTLGKSAAVALGAKDQAKLESLGYMSGPVNESLAFETDKVDPKDFVTIHEQLVVVTDLQMRGNVAAVERLCNRILKQRPDIAKAHEVLGTITPPTNGEKRRYHFVEALKLDPDRAEVHFGLGNVCAREHKLKEAEAYFREAARLAEGASQGESSIRRALTKFGLVHPVLFKARLHLADTFAVQIPRRKEAVDAYYDALYLDVLVEDSASLRFIKTNAFVRLGELLHLERRFEDAVNAYQDALTLQPGFELAREGMERAMTFVDHIDEHERREQRERDQASPGD